jgi:hypothetical protein
VLAVNGLAMQGLSHAEAISVFKNIRAGRVVIHVARRETAAANGASGIPAASKRFVTVKVNPYFVNHSSHVFNYIS